MKLLPFPKLVMGEKEIVSQIIQYFTDIDYSKYIYIKELYSKHFSHRPPSLAKDSVFRNTLKGH
jgi:hypothetical protein